MMEKWITICVKKRENIIFILELSDIISLRFVFNGLFNFYSNSRK